LLAQRGPVRSRLIHDATKAANSWQTRLEAWPLVRPVLERIYEKRFAGNGYGAFRGVFASFEEAERSAPNNKPLGFATQDYAEEFADRRSRIFSFDYPVMFWLAPLLRNPSRLFDYGGHCGTHFYAYAQYIDYSPEMRWVVCDMLEIMRYGEKIAAEQGGKQLTFTERFADADGADVLLAAGSLQYVESPTFSESLATLKSLPKHIVLNKLPLSEGPTYVTLQNGGVAFHPMHVFNRKEFIDSISGLGYKLVDQWTVPSHAGRIPFHPEASFTAHSGLYFRIND
jgi:putative methyltransferase (TIGR04325 family)